MALKEQIQEQLQTSVKERNEIKTGALRMLLSSIINKEKEKGAESELSEEQIQAVVSLEVKKRKEAKEAFEKGGRPDSAQKEEEERQILLTFLPKQLTEDEVRQLVAEAIKQTGASTLQDMGKVIALVMGQAKDKIDGSFVSGIVTELLQ